MYLQSLSVEDADAVASRANDFDIAYNAASFGEFPYPYRKEHAHNFINHAVEQAALGREFHFGIRLDSSSELVGAAAAANIDVMNRKCEIGYWLGKDYWHRGYAREAVALLMHFSFSKLGMNSIHARVFPFNHRSINLLNALGFRKEGVQRQGRLHRDGFVDEEEYGILLCEYSGIPAIVNF